MALASARAGGNSKTAIISNISPADSNFGETLSTLKFAQRAKLIKTRAILNEDTNGSLDQLRAEIKRLKAEVLYSYTCIGPILAYTCMCLETEDEINRDNSLLRFGFRV